MLVRNTLALSTLMLALTACGGGGSGSGNSGSTATGSSDTTTPSGTPGSSTTVSAIQGIVAMGMPIVGATISVVDSTGKICLNTNVVTDAMGHYQADTSNCRPPMVVTATGDTGTVDGIKYTWQSVSLTDNEVINITPLTTIVATSVLTVDPTVVFKNVVLNSTPTQLAQKLQDAQSALVSALRTANLSVPAGLDFVHSVFAADGTGIDAIMDGIKVTRDSSTGNFTVKDKSGAIDLMTVDGTTGVITASTSLGALWPDYWVYNNLKAGTPRELGTSSASLADDSAIYRAMSATTGTLAFKQGTHATINVTANYDRDNGSIMPLAGQTGNERFDGQVVAICTGGSAYAMLSKAATIVPLSELINAPAMKMEQLGVSEACPLTGGNGGPTSFQFAGNGGNITTPNGVITPAQMMAVNLSTITGASGYDRFMAFRVSVNGRVRYGLLERGLDRSGSNAPFLLLHVQH